MTAIIFEKLGEIGVIRFNRPESMNALGLLGDGQVFANVCDDINADKNLRAIVITGNGRAFSAGGDIKSMREKSGIFSGSAYEIAQNYKSEVRKMVKGIWNIEIPVIAAINGPAVGLGCDVASMADIRIASKAAKFGLSFLKIGLIPGDGGAWLAPRAFGYSRAAQLLFTGDIIDAQTAFDWGYISEITENDELFDAAIGLANRIASSPPQALRLTKTLMRKGLELNFDNILELSANAQGLMHHTLDHIEGINAIIEKRTPTFIGK